MQECAAGPIELTVTAIPGGSPLIAFTLPEPAFTPLSDTELDEMEAILGSAVLRDPAPKRVGVGPVWTIAQLPSAQAVLTLRPDFARMADFDRGAGAAGIVVYGAYGEGAEAAVEVRAFAPSLGANEDPVCGSGNGAVAAFIRDAGQVPQFGTEYLSSQGAAVGRSGRLSIAFDAGGAIRVGGQCVTCIDGSIAA